MGLEKRYYPEINYTFIYELEWYISLPLHFRINVKFNRQRNLFNTLLSRTYTKAEINQHKKYSNG
jgi:hypothetical protein